MNVTPVVRIVAALVSGIVFSALVFYASKRWGLTKNRHKEMAGVGGVAVGVIIWLLLAPQSDVVDQPAPAAQPPSETVNIPPLVFNAPNIDITLGAPTYTNDNCNCGCEEFPSQLADMFNTFAASFFANETADQAAILKAEMAAIPAYNQQYINNPLMVYATSADYSLFAATAPGTPQGQWLDY